MGKQFSASYTLQSSATGTGNGTVVDVAGYSALGLQVSGTFVGTVTFEGTVDETNYVAVQVANMNSGAVASTATAA